MKFRKGLTLIELIVALGILSILLTGVFVIYRSQMRTATTQQSISILQTDVQQALNIIKWDLLMSGYGVPANIQPVWSVNRINSSDSLILRSTGFLVGGTTRWSYVMDAMGGNEIIVRRWNDERQDVHIGDVIVIMTDRKGVVSPFLTVNSRESMSYNNQDAYRLTLSSGVQTAQGNFVFVVPGSQVASAIYWHRNDTLFRNNEPFLANVEDFQVSYWVDVNGNGVMETTERIMNPASVNNFTNFLRSTRVSIVLVGPIDRDYTYPENQVTNEDRTYSLTGIQKNRRRRFYAIEVKARNIR
ncbi:MAG: prepilin-type N-terminal cleavage/methylation domain-containing protein [candidate division WOR-3 bacterium]